MAKRWLFLSFTYLLILHSLAVNPSVCFASEVSNFVAEFERDLDSMNNQIQEVKSDAARHGAVLAPQQKSSPALMTTNIPANPTPVATDPIRDIEQELDRMEVRLQVLEQMIPKVQHVGGFVRNRHYVRMDALQSPNPQRSVASKRIEDIYQFRNDFRLETDLEWQNGVTGFTSMNMQLDYGVSAADDFQPIEETIRLHEAYADFSSENWDLRLGQQEIKWGKADGINPVDSFSPTDFTEAINFEPEERIIPVLAGYLKYHLTDSVSWEGIWMPYFTESRFAESEDDWELFFRRNYRKTLGGRALPESRPGKNLKNSVWATRLVNQSDWIDWTLSYAYHFEQAPTFKIHSDNTFDTVWERQHTIGSDFEIAKGDWGFRGETAYIVHKPFTTYNIQDDDLVEFKDYFRSVLGLDYRQGKNYFNVQYTQDVVMNHHSLMEPRVYESSSTFRIQRDLLHDRLQLELVGQYYFTDVDFYYKASMLYEINDDVDFEVGYMLFEGDETGVMGQYDKHDQFYLTTTCHF